MNLKPEYKEKLVQAFTAFIIVVISVIASMFADTLMEIGQPPISPIATPEAIVQLGTTNFDDMELSGDLTVGDDLTVTDDASIDGDLTLSGLTYNSFTNLTITNGYVLTPTKTVYALDSASAVTLTLAASASEGQPLILIGDDANNVTIADTNLRSHDGAALVLGQYDVAMLVYQDAEWIQLVELANQ